MSGHQDHVHGIGCDPDDPEACRRQTREAAQIAERPRFMTVEERYQEDVHFHHIVDAMAHWIGQMHLTPTEMREAAMLACIHHEHRTIRSFHALMPEKTILDARVRVERLRSWLDEWRCP